MTLIITRRGVASAGIAVGFAHMLPRRTRAQQKPIRIGVLTDMSGPYADDDGPGSVLASQMAVDDFAKMHPEIDVEIVSGDTQNKPEVAVSVATGWLDNQGVDVVTDVPLSSAALAIGHAVDQRDKLAIFTGAASSAITGKGCGPNHLHWVHDSWAYAHGVVGPTVKQGGRSWFFMTADYTFGHSMESDAGEFVQRAGGKVIGHARTPFPDTTDFSSYLAQARASGADVIALANGGKDTINCIKQASEFELTKGAQRLVALILMPATVRAVGLNAAHGVLACSAFDWNLNDRTRAFGRRFAARFRGAKPSPLQAGQYSATMNYLNAVAAIGVDRAKASGRAVVAQLQAKPLKDELFGEMRVRPDGRVIHDMYLLQVKSPDESKEPWDYFTLKQTIPATEAFRPMTGVRWFRAELLPGGRAPNSRTCPFTAS